MLLLGLCKRASTESPVWALYLHLVTGSASDSDGRTVPAVVPPAGVAERRHASRRAPWRILDAPGGGSEIRTLFVFNR